MVLLNKTMMCGGLVVLAPGSPVQVLAAILIMLLHLLLVLKLAPYVKQSEDWSAFFSTLGLCLLSLGAYSMMLDLKEKEMQTIGLVTTVLPLLCIVSVLGIMVFVDCGLLNALKGKNKATEKNSTQVIPVAGNNITNDGNELKNWVLPVDAGEKNTDDGNEMKNWGEQQSPPALQSSLSIQNKNPKMSRQQLRAIKKEFGTRSEEYKAALAEMGIQRKATLGQKP